jgi:hypothetical protein
MALLSRNRQDDVECLAAGVYSIVVLEVVGIAPERALVKVLQRLRRVLKSPSLAWDVAVATGDGDAVVVPSSQELQEPTLEQSFDMGTGPRRSGRTV